MGRYYNDDELMHERSHRYIDKYRSKSGKWVYIYTPNGGGGGSRSNNGSENVVGNAMNQISKSAGNALERLRKQNATKSRQAGVKFNYTVNSTKRNLRNTGKELSRSANQISKSAGNALERLRKQNATKSRVAGVKFDHTVNSTKRKLKNAATNFGNAVVEANKDKNMKQTRARVNAKNRRTRTKNAMKKSVNSSIRNAGNSVSSYLDSLFK